MLSLMQVTVAVPANQQSEIVIKLAEPAVNHDQPATHQPTQEELNLFQVCLLIYLTLTYPTYKGKGTYPTYRGRVT